MIKDALLLKQELRNFASPKAKLTRLRASGELIQIRRGLYLTKEARISPHVLAPQIYGPSYVSFQTALYLHGLIPERVIYISSASFGKNKQKFFQTPLGDFFYFVIPKGVYPYGIQLQKESEYSYLLASPEKAVCDSLYGIHRKSEQIEIEPLILSDWRIDKDMLAELDKDFIRYISPLYGKRLVSRFSNWLDSEV